MKTKKIPFASLNMILRPLQRPRPLKGTTVFLIMLLIMWQNVCGKPQDPGMFGNVASQSIAAAGSMAEMMSNAGMMSKNADLEIPFAKAKSESKAGTGAALRNDADDSDSDSDSDEDRRKRSLEVNVDTLMGEELLFSLALNHQHHLHRDKRSPCGSVGGGGTGSGGVPVDYDDTESVRRAYARKRKAAAKKAKSKKTTTGGSRKKKLISDDGEEKPASMRRKRQSEVDDLNQNMQDADNDFAQYFQQVAEKIRQTYDNFVASMTEMVQKLKQQFSGENATNTMEI